MLRSSIRYDNKHPMATLLTLRTCHQPRARASATDSGYLSIGKKTDGWTARQIDRKTCTSQVESKSKIPAATPRTTNERHLPMPIESSRIYERKRDKETKKECRILLILISSMYVCMGAVAQSKAQQSKGKLVGHYFLTCLDFFTIYSLLFIGFGFGYGLLIYW